MAAASLCSMMALMAACASRLQPAPVSQVGGAENVAVARTDEIDTNSCESLGRVSATDGLVGPRGTLTYGGTEERAMALLKVEAVKLSADTLVVTEKLESVPGSSSSTGFQIQLTASAYRCRGGPFVQR